MDDYYEPHATLVLPQPVVITALDVRPARQIVHAVGSMHGLHTVHHSDLVQHLAGQSYAELLSDPARMASLEQQALSTALADQPPPLISLPARLATAELVVRAEVILLVHPPGASPGPVDAAIIMGAERDIPGLTIRIAQLPVPRISARPEKRAVQEVVERLRGLASGA